MTSGGNGSLNLWKYSYPKARKVADEEGREKGVAGTVNLINSAIISTQPIGSFDWNSSMVRVAGHRGSGVALASWPGLHLSPSLFSLPTPFFHSRSSEDYA